MVGKKLGAVDIFNHHEAFVSSFSAQVKIKCLKQ